MTRFGNGKKQAQKAPFKVSSVGVALSIAIVVYFGTICYSLSSLDEVELLQKHDLVSPSRRAEGQTMEAPANKQPSTTTTFTKDHFRRLKAAHSAKFPITAFTEPPLNDTVPGTGSRGDMKNEKDHGIPPKLITPLPSRAHNTPDMLGHYVYPNVRTCHDMPHKLPVDRGLEIDPTSGEPIVRNVGSAPLPPDFPLTEAAAACPVELDPFLPWIHDVFPSADGSVIEFIAQNKRRCRTGKDYDDAIQRLVPQVALLQAVSVRRLDGNATEPRYRLSSVQEASPDAKYTRFICRFHIQGKIVGETLSIYPFNYEAVSFRKAINALLTAKGKDTKFFWTSNLHFQCPVPPELQTAVANSWSVLEDGTPTVFVDVVPIRTSARYGSAYHMDEKILGPDIKFFDADANWGRNYVLPSVPASGRWANIPICSPAIQPQQLLLPAKPEKKKKQKQHYLAGCLWASAEFKTRGKTKGSDSETAARIAEWIEFHLLAGFDHLYVYDNSGAHTNTTTLAPALAPFKDKVTRIEWPYLVCNNNIPAHDSTGERSSQYAAENSCLARYGPTTEWMASFDTDEYFVPMGKYESLTDVLRDVGSDVNVLSFRSSRGKLRRDKSVSANNGEAFEKSDASTFLEAYNCDSAGSPKPSWADRARKQIYRTDYVLYHYVHYSTVTKDLAETYEETLARGAKWGRRVSERSQRVTDEINEAVMIHTKSLPKDMTTGYEKRCRFDYEKKWQGCWVAFPHPKVNPKKEYDEDGYEYNCHINEKVDEYWVPKLREAIAKRRGSPSEVN